jgi:hypothetical protein
MKRHGCFGHRIAWAAALLAIGVGPAHACIRISYTISRILNESAHVSLYRVTQADQTKNFVTYSKVRDMKGKNPEDTIVLSVGYNGEFDLQGKGPAFCGKDARDYRDIMELSQVGKEMVMFLAPNGTQSEICLGNYWYQALKGGQGGGGSSWYMFHAEPMFSLAFAGRTANLAKAVDTMLAGGETVVPCFQQNEYGPLLSRTARQQRLKASLKIQDYNAQRDFVSWGGDTAELRQLAGMPGFSQYAALPAMGPSPVGVVPADFTGDGQTDLCLYSGQRVALMEHKDGGFSEFFPAIEGGGARSAAWADYNGDGRLDLLLATPAGLRLMVNQGGKFIDATRSLPPSAYPHVTAAAWIGNGKDALPDILAADGFRGLRLYRNKTAKAAAPSAPKLGKWYYVGPFDNTDGAGFATVYPPEKGVDLTAKYPGKAGISVTWKEGNFVDGQVNDLSLFEPPHNENTTVYLYRELNIGDSLDLPVSLGSDDTLTVWFNGQQVLAENVSRGCAPDQALLMLKTRPGRNTILLKVGQGGGQFAFYFSAQLPDSLIPTAFEDVSDSAGLGMNGVVGTLKGDHLAVADVNGDGRADVLYSAGNGVLLLNTSEGFKAAIGSGIHYQAGGVVPVFGDSNGDGRPDLFVPQRKGPSRLFVNEGQGRFRDVTERSGALAKAMGQATSAVWSDFCGRGKQDLIVGCLYGPNRYFRNNGDGLFIDAGEEIGLYQGVYNTQGLCTLDMNQDGVLDLVLGNVAGESAVLLGSKTRMFQAAWWPARNNLGMR